MNLTLLPGKRLKMNLRKPPTSVSVPAFAPARLLIRASVTCGGHTWTSCDPRANKRASHDFGSTDWSLSLIELRSAYRKLHKSAAGQSGAALHPKQIIIWFSFWFLSISANILFVCARASLVILVLILTPARVRTWASKPGILSTSPSSFILCLLAIWVSQ